MAGKRGGLTDQQMDEVIGNLLRVGVLVAAVLAVAGGVLYLARHGNQPADHRVFRGEPADLRSPVGIVEDAVAWLWKENTLYQYGLRSPAGIVEDALALGSHGLIQLGLFVLVATPVARVIFSVFAFLRQRDRTYVVVTLIVLAVLLYSLFSREIG